MTPHSNKIGVFVFKVDRAQNAPDAVSIWNGREVQGGILLRKIGGSGRSLVSEKRRGKFAKYFSDVPERPHEVYKVYKRLNPQSNVY